MKKQKKQRKGGKQKGNTFSMSQPQLVFIFNQNLTYRQKNNQ